MDVQALVKGGLVEAVREVDRLRQRQKGLAFDDGVRRPLPVVGADQHDYRLGSQLHVQIGRELLQRLGGFLKTQKKGFLRNAKQWFYYSVI